MLNGIFTELIYFISRKSNLSPAIVQVILLFIMWFVTIIIRGDFLITSIIFLIFLPIMLLITYFSVGKTWFEKPFKKK